MNALQIPVETCTRDKIRFVVISDTHNLHQHLEIPEGDVLVHAGDFTNKGTLCEVKNFAEWFCKQPHPVKLLIPGNHDMIIDTQYYEKNWNYWSTKHEAV